MEQAQKTIVIARYTFLEMLKSKMLWNVALLGTFIAACTYVASEFTFGVPTRVAIDLGLGSLSLSSYSIALLIGIGLIRKEEDSRTIYLIISRPVSRTTFLVGKILGLILFLLLNLILLCLLTIGVLLMLDGGVDPLILTAMAFSMLEATLLLCVVVLLSLVVNQAIALMGSLILLVAGHAMGEVLVSSFVSNPLLNFTTWFFQGSIVLTSKILCFIRSKFPFNKLRSFLLTVFVIHWGLSLHPLGYLIAKPGLVDE
jgi:ABC-type transport system involved in multi-copper enzyme maturation permease subunit